MGIIGLSYLIAPEALIRVYSQEHVVIAAGVTVLRLVAFYQIFDGVGMVLAGALNGAGDTRFTMGARQAAISCQRYFNFKTILPCHFGTFPIIDPDASKFLAEMGDAVSTVKVLEVGGSIDV